MRIFAVFTHILGVLRAVGKQNRKTEDKKHISLFEDKLHFFNISDLFTRE